MSIDDSNSIKMNRTLLRLYSTTGIVTGTSTRSETEVSGGGGGTITKGDGNVSFEIKSNTTRYQEIFLLDEENNEHVFNLMDFLVPCRKGNLLTIVGGVEPGEDQGSYISAYNHDTQIMSYDDEILERYFRPKLLSLILYPTSIIITTVIALLIVYSGVTGLEPPSIIGAVFMLIGFIAGIRGGWGIAKMILGKITNKKLETFKINTEWKSLIEGFKQISKENYKVVEAKT